MIMLVKRTKAEKPSEAADISTVDLLERPQEMRARLQKIEGTIKTIVYRTLNKVNAMPGEWDGFLEGS